VFDIDDSDIVVLFIPHIGVKDINYHIKIL